MFQSFITSFVKIQQFKFRSYRRHKLISFFLHSASVVN